MYNRQEGTGPKEPGHQAGEGQWKHLFPEEATWEMEDCTREAYPFLFQEDPEEAN